MLTNFAKSWCNHILNPSILHILIVPTTTRCCDVSLSLLEVFSVSKEHPLCVEDPQLGHEVEIDEGQADQQVLHQIEERCDKAEEGNEADAHEEEG